MPARRRGLLALGAASAGVPAECHRARMWSLWPRPPDDINADALAALTRLERLARLDELCAGIDRASAPTIVTLWHSDPGPGRGLALEVWRELRGGRDQADDAQPT